MSNRLEKIINLKLNNFEIKVPEKKEMIEPNPCWEGYEAIGTKIVDGREVPNCVPIKATEEFITEYIPYDDIAEQYCNCDYGYTAIGFKIGDRSEYKCVEENSQEAMDYNAAQLVMKLEALLKEMDKSMS